MKLIIIIFQRKVKYPKHLHYETILFKVSELQLSIILCTKTL